MFYRYNPDFDLRTLERQYAQTGDPELLRQLNQQRQRMGLITTLSIAHLTLLAEDAAKLLKNLDIEKSSYSRIAKCWVGLYKRYPIKIVLLREDRQLGPTLQVAIDADFMHPRIELIDKPTSLTDCVIEIDEHGRSADLDAHQPWVYSAKDVLDHLISMAKKAGIAPQGQPRSRSGPTNKRRHMRQARAIRIATGLPMNVCLVISKRLIRREAFNLDDHPLVGRYLEYQRRCMDPQCNCEDHRVITGPKGAIEIPVWGGGWSPV